MVVFWLKKFLKDFIPSKVIISTTLLSFSIGMVITHFFPETFLNWPITKWFFSEYKTIYGVNAFIFFFTVFSGNIMINSLVIISGVVLILPLTILFMNFMLFGAVMSAGIHLYGLIKVLLLFLGLLYIYPEFLALMLAANYGLKIAKIASFVYKKEGLSLLFKSDFNSEIKEAIVNEFLNVFPKLILLLAIAALLETLWGPFWHDYWLQYVLKI